VCYFKRPSKRKKTAPFIVMADQRDIFAPSNGLKSRLKAMEKEDNHR
jgi:hypothetical protein